MIKPRCSGTQAVATRGLTVSVSLLAACRPFLLRVLFFWVCSCGGLLEAGSCIMGGVGLEGRAVEGSQYSFKGEVKVPWA